MLTINTATVKFCLNCPLISDLINSLYLIIQKSPDFNLSCGSVHKEFVSLHHSVSDWSGSSTRCRKCVHNTACSQTLSILNIQHFLMTYNWQISIRKASLSLWLRWDKNTKENLKLFFFYIFCCQSKQLNIVQNSLLTNWSVLSNPDIAHIIDKGGRCLTTCCKIKILQYNNIDNINNVEIYLLNKHFSGCLHLGN